MRKLMVGVVACLSLCAAVAGAADVKPFATVQKFIDSFNKGEAAAAAATHSASADLAIVDEVAPYQWNGPQAFQSWAAALEADAKKNGITEPGVTLSAPTRELVERGPRLSDRADGLQLQTGRQADEREGTDDRRAAEGRGRLADPRLDLDGAESEARRSPGRQALGQIPQDLPRRVRTRAARHAAARVRAGAAEVEARAPACGSGRSRGTAAPGRAGRARARRVTGWPPVMP